jgi:hypothetical protein
MILFQKRMAAEGLGPHALKTRFGISGIHLVLFGKQDRAIDQ